MAYVITDDCLACGACAEGCPVEAIKAGDKLILYSQAHFYNETQIDV